MGLNQKQKISRLADNDDRMNKRIAELEVELIYTQEKLNRKSIVFLFAGLILTPIAFGWDIISQFFLLQYHPGLGIWQIIGILVGLLLIFGGLI